MNHGCICNVQLTQKNEKQNKNKPEYIFFFKFYFKTFEKNKRGTFDALTFNAENNWYYVYTFSFDC